MWGDIWAREAIREFERFDTLSEVGLLQRHFMRTYMCSVQLWNICRSNVICTFALGVHAQELRHCTEGTATDFKNMGNPWKVL